MKKITVLLITLFAISFIGCKQYIELKGVEKDNLKKTAAPIAENIMIAINEGDYEKYSKDFDATMKTQLPEKVFKQNQKIIDNKIGKYKSMKFIKALKKDQYKIALYEAVFSKEKNVKVKVVLQKIGEDNKVSGLWFDSKKLRK